MISTSMENIASDQNGTAGMNSSWPIALRLAAMMPNQRASSLPPRA